MNIKLGSTDTILKIVAIAVVALWACAGATRLLYPGVWKWIVDKSSCCMLCLCKPCRSIYGLTKPPPDHDLVGLKHHYVLPVGERRSESFSKSFSERPRKSEGSLRNPHRKREMSNMSTGAATFAGRGQRLSGEAISPPTNAFPERKGTTITQRGRGRRRGGGGRGRGRRPKRDSNFDYTDASSGRNSSFDFANPLQDDEEDFMTSPEDDGDVDLEAGSMDGEEEEE